MGGGHVKELVKAFVTLAIVFTFCFMTLRGMELPNDFVMIATATVTYHFCRGRAKE